jgi:hypothetical protein
MDAEADHQRSGTLAQPGALGQPGGGPGKESDPN